jgi:eukaryotic-like serine/threonine-protein kinase
VPTIAASVSIREGEDAPSGHASRAPTVEGPGARDVSPPPSPDASGPRIVVRPHAREGDARVESMADTALSSPATLATHALAEATPDTTRDGETPATPHHAEAPRASAADSPEGLLGAVLLGRYKVTAQIGQGGMGAVYEAVHTMLGKRVAIKVLLDKHVHKDQVVARLEQEARLASSIGNEHIIDITDFGETPDGRTFVVMEYLEGQSLAECLNRAGPLPESRAIHIALQVGPGREPRVRAPEPRLGRPGSRQMLHPVHAGSPPGTPVPGLRESQISPGSAG